MRGVPVPDDLPTAYRDSSMLADGAAALTCACLRCVCRRVSAAHKDSGGRVGCGTYQCKMTHVLCIVRARRWRRGDGVRRPEMSVPRAARERVGAICAAFG